MEEWHVLRTRYQKEGVVESHLSRRLIQAFVPRMAIVKRWKDRQAKLMQPMFPGYVFVRPGPEEASSLDYIPGACGLVLERQRPGVVPAREIERLRRLSGACLPVEIHPGLLPGIRVRTLAGPLAGIEGELVRINNSRRLVIHIPLLGRSASVEVDSADVRPL